MTTTSCLLQRKDKWKPPDLASYHEILIWPFEQTHLQFLLFSIFAPFAGGEASQPAAVEQPAVGQGQVQVQGEGEEQGQGGTAHIRVRKGLNNEIRGGLIFMCLLSQMWIGLEFCFKVPNGNRDLFNFRLSSKLNREPNFPSPPWRNDRSFYFVSRVQLYELPS